ncbi:MAG: diguanylate cyclase [Vicinamibacteria bacterium]
MLTVSRNARFATAFTLLALLALVTIPPMFDRSIEGLRDDNFVVTSKQEQVTQVLLALAIQVASIRGFQLDGEERFLDEYREAHAQQTQALQDLRSSPELKALGFGPDVEKLETAALLWSEVPEQVASLTVDRTTATARVRDQQTRYRAALEAGRSLDIKMRAFLVSHRARVGQLQRVWSYTSLALALIAIICAVVILKSLNRTLAQGELARRDPLTSLLNRRGFAEASKLLVRRAERAAVQMTLMCFDLDGFKRVNDLQGHAAGDQLLKDLAEILEKKARRTDLVARLGGDEFAVLLEHPRGEGPKPAVRRLRDDIQSAINEKNWPVTLSVGAVAFSPKDADLDALNAEADLRMYEAKRAGKNTIRIGEPNAEG